jgi:hypothetical protein
MDFPSLDEQGIDPVQEPVQLVLTVTQTISPVDRGLDLPGHFGLEAGPCLARDQGVDPTVILVANLSPALS